MHVVGRSQANAARVRWLTVPYARRVTRQCPEIDVVQRSFVLKKHVRRKYRCECGAAPVTSEGPLRMPGGGLYSLDFAIDVAFNKYSLHLPLERQARWTMQQGLDMSSSTLWDQIEKLARVLTPAYDALRPYVLSGRDDSRRRNALAHAHKGRKDLVGLVHRST